MADLDQETGADLAQLVAVLADTRYALGRRLAEWSVGPPTLEGSVAAAAVAQQLLGQARVTYPLLDDLPSPAGGPVDADGLGDRERTMACLARSWETWPEAVATLHLADAACTVLLEALRDSGHEPLAKRAVRLLADERLLRQFAEGRVRELHDRFPGTHDAYAAAVAAVTPEVLAWFGPADEAPVARLREAGLLDGDGDAWRARWRESVTPVLAEAGVDVPEGETAGETAWPSWDPVRRRLTA